MTKFQGNNYRCIYSNYSFLYRLANLFTKDLKNSSYFNTKIPNIADSTEPIITATLMAVAGQPSSKVNPPINKLKVKPIPPKIAIEQNFTQDVLLGKAQIFDFITG